MELSILEILSAFMVLFAVIDITGSIPILLDLKAKGGELKAMKIVLVSLVTFAAFLFFGDRLLGLFGVDISSFAIAGAIVLFLIALEMIMGIELFRNESPQAVSIVPVAIPLVAGPGSITTVLSLRAEYDPYNIAIALVANMVIVYIVLRSTHFFERLLGQSGILIFRKIFGIVLMAIAIKLFKTNTGLF